MPIKKGNWRKAQALQCGASPILGYTVYNEGLDGSHRLLDELASDSHSAKRVSHQADLVALRPRGCGGRALSGESEHLEFRAWALTSLENYPELAFLYLEVGDKNVSHKAY